MTTLVKVVENNAVFFIPTLTSYAGVKLFQAGWEFPGYVICGLSSGWLLLTVGHCVLQTYINVTKLQKGK